MCRYVVQKDFTNLVRRAVVGDGKFEVEPSFFFCAVVHYLAVGNLAVGDIYRAVFQGHKLGMNEADLFDSPAHSAHFNIVADLERLDGEKHQPRQDVGQQPLDGEGDSQSGNAKYRYQRCYLDPKRARHHHKDNKVEDKSYRSMKELVQSNIHV
ncbi:hypothetical protein SDC9_186420 [bioreactor metagenome]|uniref:Uncharacterized protein n=1 Tax=bioreactor metagenome TaxID=1076179 RepID=A0A645HIR1_9ZZZZ